MIFRSILIAFISLFSANLLCGQSLPLVPIYNNKAFVDHTLTLYSDSGGLSITALKANIIKVSFIGLGEQITELDTIKKRDLNIRVTQNLDDVFFATDSLWVIVSKVDLSIRFLKKADEQLLVKNDSYFLNNPNRSFSFSLNTDDKPMVLDARKLKSFRRKTESAKRLNFKKRLCNPILLSRMGYAVVVENPTSRKITAKAITKSEIQFSGGGNGLKTFYFLSGNSAELGRGLSWIGNLRGL